MSTRDKDLKQAFLKLFSEKLREISPGYFTRRKIDESLGNLDFSEEDLTSLEEELRNVLLTGGTETEDSETQGK